MTVRSRGGAALAPWILLAALTLAALPGGAAGAATVGGVLRVPQQVATLQQAIAVIADGGIVELAAGTYPAPAAGFLIANENKSFTVRGAQGAAVVLGGGGSHPVLVLRNSARAHGGLVVFQNLIFRNGGGGGPATAAGVTVDAGEARFVGCTFDGNHGGAGVDGGAVKVRNGSTATFIGCTFTGNSSPTSGGAMLVNLSSVAILGGTWSGNQVNLADSSAASLGGAISVVNGTLQVADALFAGNQANWVGGAIYAIGDFTGTPPPPPTSVTLTRCTFEDNAVAPQAPPPGDPTGGAVHVEDQTTLTVAGSWFVDNQAQFGGAVDSYRALVDVTGSTFQGNRGDIAAADPAIGGAICSLSNDQVDGSTAGGQNPRPAGLTIAGSLFEGRHGTSGPVANGGGCVLAAGDSQHLYGLGGLTPDGTLQSNRSPVAISGTVFSDCDIQRGTAGGGTGGAIDGALVELTLAGSLLLGSDAAGTAMGGGLYLSTESDAQISQTLFAGDTADMSGGALFATGSNVDIAGSTFIANQVSPGVAEPLALSRGAALFFQPLGSGQPHAGTGDASGLVAATTFSQNVGLPIWDLDAAGPGPINTVQYSANSLYNTTFGDKVYLDTLADPSRVGEDVAALDSLVVSHVGAPAVAKSPVANVALPAPPTAGALVAMPPAGAPTARSAPFLAYAWSGRAATLNGGALAQPYGLLEGVDPGTYTLAVGGAAVATATVPPGGCTTGPWLCLASDRFRVQVQWQLSTGQQGDGTAVALSDDTGYFWFFDPTSVELVVKILDGRSTNGDFWVFYAALSNVAYTLTVTDTVTGAVNAYLNPQGQLAAVADTAAFLGTGQAPAAPPVTAPPTPPRGPCATADTQLCLADRFRVTVAWQTATAAGTGTAVPLTTDTGYYWFFAPTSAELVVKILDGRAVNGDFWVFYAALSNVAYTLKITDTQTGRTKLYTNPQGRLASVADTAALPGP